jgi:hypothetical protein
LIWINAGFPRLKLSTPSEVFAAMESGGSAQGVVGAVVEATSSRLPVLDEGDIAPMVARHAAMRALCGELEDCANHLPDRRVIRYAAALSADLVTALRDCEALGRDIWQRITGAGCDAPADTLLGRMRHYHAADQLHAEDVHEALLRAAARPGLVHVDTLSYMMRCLFDGCRRCIDCREAALLLLARDRMSASARSALTASLDKSWALA